LRRETLGAERYRSAIYSTDPFIILPGTARNRQSGSESYRSVLRRLDALEWRPVKIADLSGPRARLRGGRGATELPVETAVDRSGRSSRFAAAGAGKSCAHADPLASEWLDVDQLYIEAQPAEKLAEAAPSATPHSDPAIRCSKFDCEPRERTPFRFRSRCRSQMTVMEHAENIDRAPWRVASYEGEEHLAPIHHARGVVTFGKLGPG
jgi:hypothetical protein